MNHPIVRKLSKTCDACKSRKVRCTRSNEATQLACRNCIARNTLCHYSYAKQPRKRKLVPTDAENIQGSSVRGSEPSTPTPTCQTALSTPIELLNHTSISARQDPNTLARSTGSRRHEETSTTVPLPSTSGNECQLLSPKLYVDLLLEDRQTPAKHKDENYSNKFAEFFGPSSNLAFFSTSRVHSLNGRLGHTKLNQLMERIDALLNSRIKTTGKITQPYSLRGSDKAPPPAVGSLATSCMRSYFEQVHPVYPFLERAAFEHKVSEQTSSPSPPLDEALSALYYAILAIGCQYNDGGSFDPGNGQAWSFFERALSFFPEILMMKGSLMAVQALTAMAIFTTTVSAWQFEFLMISEAAKMVQNMGYNKATSPTDKVRHRTFWVLYCLEKTSSFITGRTSLIMDSDIGCPIPYVPESVFGNYDWFLSLARYARIISRIYSSLFTINSKGHTTAIYHASIRQLHNELETWRMSIPEQYRPQEPIRGRGLPGTLEISIAVHTQYLYFNALLTLLRISLHVGADEIATAHQQETKRQLITTACSILDLTKYIEVATYTSLWMMALMPISALFILFDLVVHNPTHPETNNNLALLDVASGHFSRLEYASRGTLPGSLIAEFAHIARDYVRDVQRGELGGNKDYNRNITTNSNLYSDRRSQIAPSNTRHISDQVQFPDRVHVQAQSQHHNILLPRDGFSTAAVSQTIPTTGAPPTPASISVPVPPEQNARRQSTFQPSQPFVALNPINSQPGADTRAGPESLFFPLVDDPSYYMPEEEVQQLLGIDVMDLFDLANLTASGVSYN